MPIRHLDCSLTALRLLIIHQYSTAVSSAQFTKDRAAMPQLDVIQLTPAIGAEISGIDLSAPLTDEISDTIYQLLLDHQVLFFRNQDITPAAHVALAKSLGETEEPHPIYPHFPDYPGVMVLDFDGDNPQDTNVWHTDLTFKSNGPFCSILYSRKIPPVGGDTLWASLTAAYESLPDGIKEEVADLRAVNDMGDFRNNFIVGEPDGNAEKLNQAYSRLGSAIHPLVRLHPVTGAPFLFCNPAFTVHIEGLKATDSARLLAYLFDHITQPEYQVRFRWEKNAVAMWDNRCTMHYALYDYAPHRRIMHRVTVTNDRRADDLKSELKRVG